MDRRVLYVIGAGVLAGAVGLGLYMNQPEEKQPITAEAPPLDQTMNQLAGAYSSIGHALYLLADWEAYRQTTDNKPEKLQELLEMSENVVRLPASDVPIDAREALGKGERGLDILKAVHWSITQVYNNIITHDGVLHNLNKAKGMIDYVGKTKPSAADRSNALKEQIHDLEQRIENELSENRRKTIDKLTKEGKWEIYPLSDGTYGRFVEVHNAVAALVRDVHEKGYNFREQDSELEWTFYTHWESPSRYSCFGHFVITDITNEEFKKIIAASIRAEQKK